MEKGDFAGLELGPPDISIRNMEARTYFVIVLFWGVVWVAGCYASVQLTRPPRHDPGAPNFENANESSFICKRICMYYHARVFLAIISHSKRDTIN